MFKLLADRCMQAAEEEEVLKRKRFDGKGIDQK